MRSARWSLTAIVLVVSLFVAACGPRGTGAGEELVAIDLLFPGNQPIFHGYRVADEAGYYADEGLSVSMQFLAGGGEAATQLIAGNAEVAIIPVGVVVEALEEGHTNLRAIWNQVYGSIFSIATPSDSGITSAADLAGRRVGISDLAGGEVPIVRGIIDSAGLTEEDVELIPIGAGTAIAFNAIDSGEVDAVGGAIDDIVALQVQGLDLNFIVPDALLQLPASGIVASQETLDANPELIEGFLRATTKGFYWAQVNPDATLAVLQKVTPEQFEDETGDLLFEAVIPLTWAPEGTLMGFQSPDTWATFFDFIGAEQPDVPLSEIVTDEFLEAANDFDRAAVEEDADNYTP